MLHFVVCTEAPTEDEAGFCLPRLAFWDFWAFQ
jgi:hypothetical protein